MKKIQLAIGLVAVAAMSVTSAQASLTADGGPVGDWNQQFEESGVGNFTSMEVVSGSGNQFQVPVFTSFSDGSWSQVAGGSTVALASGTALNDLYFNLNFVDPQVPTVFDFYAFNGTTVVENTRVTWNNGYSYGSAPLPPAPVPEPTTIVAAALMLLPFGVSTLRIMRKKVAA